MLIPSYDGSEVEITLSGNRWPQLEGGRQTLYWLKVSIRILAPFGSIQLCVPCLLDWEVEELIQWLEAIAHTEPAKPSIHFYEGTLAFDLISSERDEIFLRCHLLALAEQWTLQNRVNRRDFHREHQLDQEIDLLLSRNLLAYSVSQLRNEFSALPLKTFR